MAMVLYDNQGNYIVGGQLLLATKRGNQIPNDRAPQMLPERMAAARDMVVKHHHTAVPRALSSTYNCVGMVFASRRTCIDIEEFQMIQREDEYTALKSLDDAVVGDVVVYRNDEGQACHVGLVASRAENPVTGRPETMVLSQWGRDGEYFHRIDDVHEAYGTRTEVWTDRKGLA